MTDIPADEYCVQGVFQPYETYHRQDGHTLHLPRRAVNAYEGGALFTAPGTLFSGVAMAKVAPGATVAISVDRTVPAGPAVPPPDTDYIKHVKLRSPSLSLFWGKDIFLEACVLLPFGFHERPAARYPLFLYQVERSLRVWNSAIRFPVLLFQADLVNEGCAPRATTTRTGPRRFRSRSSRRPPTSPATRRCRRSMPTTSTATGPGESEERPAVQHRHCSTATAAPPLRHRHCSTATAAPPLQHRHCSTATAAPPLRHRHCSTATALPTLQHRHCSTATALPPLRYQHCSTATAAPPLRYRHCGTHCSRRATASPPHFHTDAAAHCPPPPPSAAAPLAWTRAAPSTSAGGSS
jgi:hypothetical protein